MSAQAPQHAGKNSPNCLPAGKSVTVPQWVYDHNPSTRALPVAVLVPRRAIAEGLGKYVSESRGCVLGDEVGMAVAGTVHWTRDTRIVFMTYGFFAAVTTCDKHFSRYMTCACTPK